MKRLIELTGLDSVILVAIFVACISGWLSALGLLLVAIGINVLWELLGKQR